MNIPTISLYLLKRSGKLCRICSPSGMYIIEFKHSDVDLIHVENILEAVPNEMPNRSPRSPNKSPRRSFLNVNKKVLV